MINTDFRVEVTSDWEEGEAEVTGRRYTWTGQTISKVLFIKIHDRASLVAQWLRICLPMQGTRVRALVWEDPTCRGATRPVSHNY